ncbi:MAG: mechanosensitive ion channel [Bacteroidales bacterium]|jgi:miniconductance mechanosensitive channel|nr:mechanosensitive ion channel [Bacteroidales bacterium]
MENFEQIIESFFVHVGVADSFAMHLRLLVLMLGLLIVSWLIFVITKRIVIHYVYVFIKKTSITWDDVLADHNVFDNVAHIMPALVVKAFAPQIFSDFTFILPTVITLTDVYLIIVGMTVVFAFLKVAELWSSSRPAFQDKPLTSYFQLIRIILYIITGIFVLSIILGKSPVYFLSAFGAISAVILLIFKDTILGLVASIQMSANDMVKVGDWVEMPKFNADGDVIAIYLTTVKVRNWDKTITTIPTYFFVTDSFKNWRGMVRSGGRRIMRSLFIDVQTVRLIDPETREKYKEYALVTDYIETRQAEIEEFNVKHNADSSVLINGRRMTNIGLFRKYIQAYLSNHPGVRSDMLIMVRQLATEDRGIPIQVYCFTNTTVWAEYENTQADIFDHLFSAVHFFDLDIFQKPTGKDIYRFTRNGDFSHE